MKRSDARALPASFNREAELARSYNALLRGDAALAARSFDVLTRAHDDQNLLFQDRLLCSVLRPRLLPEDQFRLLVEVSECLATLLERCGPALLKSQEHLRLMGASEQEVDIWNIDPGYSGFTLTSRLDAFVAGDMPKFVEYNAESPAGIGYCDALADVFETLPAFLQWGDGQRADRFYGRQLLLETLVSAYRMWGGTDVPSVAIIDWDHVVTRRDFELCAEYLRAQGVSVHITDPRRLRYRDGTLWSDGNPITLVYRRVLLHELLDHAEEARDLFQAYRDGAVCMVNSPRSKLLHKKGLFALVSENRLPIELTAYEQSVVDRVVPWTRLVEDRDTSWNGQTVNLVSLIRSQRDRFTLKPVDDYGGRGVVLGWEVDDAAWDREVESALESQFVVQERVSVPESEFPVWCGDHCEFAAMIVDTDPLIFAGRVGGVLTRISGSPLLNVSAGSGSTTPTFTVQEI